MRNREVVKKGILAERREIKRRNGKGVKIPKENKDRGEMGMKRKYVRKNPCISKHTYKNKLRDYRPSPLQYIVF